MTKIPAVLFGTDIPDPERGGWRQRTLPDGPWRDIDGRSPEEMRMDHKLADYEKPDEVPIFDARPYLIVASIITSALYLAAVFTAGLTTDNRLAWSLAIATMGVCYLAATLQMMAIPRSAAILLLCLSIVMGLAALVM